MKKLLISLIVLFCAGSYALAQYKYEFTTVKVNPATPVKNQASTGTCWCFATNSFIESELLRMGKGEYDLSEMYIVRMNYVQRIWDNYLRAGDGNIGPGSIAHMYIKRMSESGLLPEAVYDGLNYGSKFHNHKELSQWVKSASEISIKNKRPLQPEILNGILDAYLGKVPAKFTYKGKEYTPMSFYKSLGINSEDYIELTSVTHHPFYERVPLEISDNWDHELLYNVPIDELIKIMDNAIEKGYTIAWDGDVSEKAFSHGNHIALNTDESLKNAKERIVETPVTQESRQAGIENFTSTDDHLMHITGISKDQNGAKYYITKNSWGTEGMFQGYLNMSESFVRAKSVSMLVNKNSIPKGIREKLGI